jgi:hypothetical protein
MRGVVRLYQNHNTVDLDCGTYLEAHALFLRLNQLQIPDVHLSIWTVPHEPNESETT